MASKSKAIKKVKVSFSLSSKEGELLKLYAARQGLHRSVAIKKILKEHLQPFAEQLKKEGPENQLGLFDTVLQYDIFNNASVDKSSDDKQ